MNKLKNKNTTIYDIASLILLFKESDPLDKLLSLALSNVFHYVTEWRVKGKIEQVYEVLYNDQEIVKWWPSVHLNVQSIDAGEVDGEGKIINLETKGWMPYTLYWKYRVIKSNKPNYFEFEAWGDITGKGSWKLSQDGDYVNVTHDWTFSPKKTAFKFLAPIFKPVSYFNHQWGMKKGEESLKLELARKNAKSSKELNKIPPPPSPTTQSPVPLIAGVLLGIFLVFKILSVLNSLFRKKNY
ncbi:MAG: hypothetical protein QNJ31_06670 [Candidatus Caenarcaniphilales bacterium]|nr:hypothetical protein [Candidatus Caenarcaniphilales bacterium]